MSGYWHAPSEPTTTHLGAGPSGARGLLGGLVWGSLSLSCGVITAPSVAWLPGRCPVTVCHAVPPWPNLGDTEVTRGARDDGSPAPLVQVRGGFGAEWGTKDEPVRWGFTPTTADQPKHPLTWACVTQCQHVVCVMQRHDVSHR